MEATALPSVCLLLSNLANARALHQQALSQIQAGRNAGLYKDTWCDESADSISQELTQPQTSDPEHQTICLLAWTCDVSVTLLNLVGDVSCSLSLATNVIDASSTRFSSVTETSNVHAKFPLALLFARMQIGNVLVLNSKGSRKAVIVHATLNHFFPVILCTAMSQPASCPASLHVAVEMGYVNIGGALQYMPTAQPDHPQQLVQQAALLMLQPVNYKLTVGMSMGILHASMDTQDSGSSGRQLAGAHMPSQALDASQLALSTAKSPLVTAPHVSRQHRESGPATQQISSHCAAVQLPRSSTAWPLSTSAADISLRMDRLQQQLVDQQAIVKEQADSIKHHGKHFWVQEDLLHTVHREGKKQAAALQVQHGKELRSIRNDVAVLRSQLRHKNHQLQQSEEHR